jgi:hypothetical protein
LSYTQDFFTSRNVVVGDEQKIGQEGRLWYDPVTNSIRVSDGVTPGGIFVGTGAPYQLPIATNTVLGGIKVDGTTIVINPTTGEISSTTGDAYILQNASSTVLGGVKVGDNLTIDENGVLSANPYALPTASDTIIGGVRVDNSTIKINNGVISAEQYTLPVASDIVLGGVKIGTGLFIDAQSRLNANPYSLPVANSSTLGGVKVDNSSIKIDEAGYISYDLPIASQDRLGAIKVGSGLVIDESGVLSITNNLVSSLSPGQGIILSSATGNITVSTRLATTGSVGSVRVDNSTIVVDSTGRISVTTSGIVGTVKSVAINSARGFFGDVEFSTTYPTITLGTSVNGLIKGFNGALIPAEANIDYQLPISFTTNGLTGPATFTNNVLNIPQYQGKLSLRTLGTSGPATFIEDILNIPDYGSVTSINLLSDDLSITGTNPITRSGSMYLALNTVPVSKGGTGRTRFDAGYLISDGNTLSTVNTISGSSIVGNITGKSSGLTQILNPEFGGTGTDNLNTLFNSMLPSQTGNANKILSTDGGGILSWVDQTAAAVTSVGVSGGSTGLTTVGGPIDSVNKTGVITLSGTLNIASGGTGATDPATARDNLSAAKRGANSDITSLSGLTTSLSIEQGGTGATSASDARITLNAAQRGVNSDITRLTGLTTPLSVSQGGTGATTASGARINLSVAKSGVNSDITSLTGLEVPLTVEQGGTGSNTAIGARLNLSAAKSGANTDITSLSGLTTPLSVNQGGTGANNATDARINLSAAKSGANSDITSLSNLTTPLSVEQGGTGLSNLIGPNRALYSTSSISLVAGTLPVAAGGTGGENANTARINLSAAKSGANSDITSLSGLTTPLSIEQGGTGTSDPSVAIDSFLPPQTGNKDKVLTTNGTKIRWDTAKPGAIGLTGQLQYNNEGFLGATSRIFYDGRGELTVGNGSTESFIFTAAEAKDIQNGGTSIEIRAGDSFDAEGIQTLSAGNLYLTGGRGIGLADSGHIAFRTGQNSEEVFRINSTGSWAFDGVVTSTGQVDTILVSRGPDLTPKWDPMISSYDKMGIIQIYPTGMFEGYPYPVLSGLEFAPSPINGKLSLRAKVVDIDESTIVRNNTDGRIYVDSKVLSAKILPSLSGNAGKFLTTDGLEVLYWSNYILPKAGVGPSGELGAVKVDGQTIIISENGVISVSLEATDPFPNQANQAGKLLTTDGSTVFWTSPDSMLEIAGVGADGNLGAVRVDGSSIKISENNGVIRAVIDGILPPVYQGDTIQRVLGYGFSNDEEKRTIYDWVSTRDLDLPIAGDGLGLVNPDGITIKIDANGVISTDINYLLPNQSGNAGKFLTTNGVTATWINTSLPIASETVAGVVALDTQSIVMDERLRIKTKHVLFETMMPNIMFNLAGKSSLAEQVYYSDSTTGTMGGEDPPTGALTLGDRFNEDSTKFEINTWRGVSLSIKTEGGVPYFKGGDINISAGNSSYDAGAGAILIRSGDGYNSYQYRTPGGNIVIQAGSGVAGEAPTQGTTGYSDVVGGNITLITSENGEGKSRLKINDTGSWTIGEISEQFPTIASLTGAAGQPLLSNGIDGVPYWGTVPLEFGGTGANTRVDALNNLLPSQSDTENFVLASNGDYAYWTSLQGNTLLPIATVGRLGVIKPDGSTLMVNQDGVISVITDGPIGTVKSIDISGGTTGLIATGGPITTNGTITLGGVVNIESGGTGATTAEAAIKNLLPAQNQNTVGKSLVSNGSYGEWIYPTTVISPGLTGNFLFNQNGIIGGTTNINYAEDCIILGEGKETEANIFSIFGASSGAAGPHPYGILIQPGTQTVSDNFGANLYLKGGTSVGEYTPGGDVYIDGGISGLGAGGNIIFRTTLYPGTPLIERFVIDNSGEWIVNGAQGSEGQVLTSNGPNTSAIWKFPTFNAGGLIGDTLASTVKFSSLIRLGVLDRLYVKERTGTGGGIGIGTTNPLASLHIAHRWIGPGAGEDENSIRIHPTETYTTISCISTIYVNEAYNTRFTDLIIESNSIDIKTESTSRLKINSNGSWSVQGNSGNAGEVLTSNGAGASPQWKSKAPDYEELTATAAQTVVTTVVKTVANSATKSYLQVFLNGVLQRQGSTKSYQVTGSNEITFNSPLELDDEITIYSFV